MVKNNYRNNGDKRGRRFFVFGRALPTEENANPEIMAVRVYAPNAAFARSKFWKTTRILKRIKKTRGEILKVQEIFEQGRVKAKNYAIFLKYRSHTGVHNCVKEFRAVSLKSAIDQMYNEMGGNYRRSKSTIEIIKTMELTEDQMKLRNPRCRQWLDVENIQFPLWKKTARRTHKRFNSPFSANRPVAIKNYVNVEA